MTIKSFIIAAATGLCLIAAVPASAHQFAPSKAQTVNHYKHGHGDRQYIPLRRIIRMIRRMERREAHRGHGRHHHWKGRHNRRHERHGRRHQRRYY